MPRASPDAPFPCSPWVRDVPRAKDPKGSRDAATHVDLEDGGAHGGVLQEADVVERLAEHGPVVVLVDQVDFHPREADVVRDALVGEELGKATRQGWRCWEAWESYLSFIVLISLTSWAS